MSLETLTLRHSGREESHPTTFADRYAMGTAIHEAISGRVPFVI